MIYKPREDSYLLREQVKKYAKNRIVLDIGTGSGIQALAAKEAGAKSVTASDILGEAVKEVCFMGIKCVKSNLFSKIKGRFDLIIFNPLYLPKDPREPKDSRLATTGGRRGDEVIILFLNQVKPHMNKNAVILLLLSSLTPQDRIALLLKELKLEYQIIATEKLFMENLFVWEIKDK